MNSSPAHTQSAVPAADSVSGTPDAPARTGYVPGPDTLRAETAFAGTNFANPAFANPAFADGGSAPFSVAATGAAPSEWRDTTSAAIFGAQSTLAEPARIPLAPPPPLAENAVFQSFVLLLAATYAMLLYRNLGDVRTLLGRISRDAATGKRFSEDPGGSGYSRFLNIATAIGLLFLGVAAVKYSDTLMPGRLAASIPQGAALIFSLLVSLASLGIAAYQTIAVRLAGALTLSQPFIAQTHLFRPRDDPHFTPAAALRTLPAGHGRRLVLHHRRRIGRSGRLIPQGDIKPVSFQKSFDFALVFVPLHRGSLPCQPIMAACSKMKRQRQT